jgi:hypothetical protein
MTRTNDVHHVQIVLFDQPVEVDIEEVQSRCCAPMRPSRPDAQSALDPRSSFNRERDDIEYRQATAPRSPPGKMRNWSGSTPNCGSRLGQITRPITAASRTRPPDRLSAPARRSRRRSRIEGSRISAEACAAPNREPVQPTCKQYHRHRKGQRVPAQRR